MMKNHSDFTVHLHRDGELHSFPPGAHIPDWAQELITNPYVHGEGAPDPRAAAGVRASSPDPERPGPAEERAEAGADEPGAEDLDADTAPADGDLSRPPESGIGSGQPVWAEYARSKGVDVHADWKREDIIAACAKAGC